MNQATAQLTFIPQLVKDMKSNLCELLVQTSWLTESEMLRRSEIHFFHEGQRRRERKKVLEIFKFDCMRGASISMRGQLINYSTCLD